MAAGTLPTPTQRHADGAGMERNCESEPAGSPVRDREALTVAASPPSPRPPPAAVPAGCSHLERGLPTATTGLNLVANWISPEPKSPIRGSGDRAAAPTRPLQAREDLPRLLLFELRPPALHRGPFFALARPRVARRRARARRPRRGRCRGVRRDPFAVWARSRREPAARPRHGTGSRRDRGRAARA